MFYLLTLFTYVVTVSFYKNQATWIIRPKDIHFNSRTLVSQVIHRGSATQKSLRALIHSLINPPILCPIQNIVKFEHHSILYFTIIDDAFSRLTIRLHICLHRNQINRDFALDHVTVNLFLDSSTAIGKAHQCVYSRSSKQIVYGVETLEEKTVAENKIFSILLVCVQLIIMTTIHHTLKLWSLMIICAQKGLPVGLFLTSFVS